MTQATNSKSSQASREQTSNKNISIGGDVVNSTVVLGDNNNIYVNQSNQKPKIERLPGPIFVGRRTDVANLLDREQERDVIRVALDAKSPVEIYSADGFGKTTLISSLSSQLQLPDGMVFFSIRAKSLDDLFFDLFTAFYKSDQVYKPSKVEYLRLFSDLHALIVLDDVGLTREDVQVLLSALPVCVFILSSGERHLWDKGDVIRLTGLPPEFSIRLFENRLGRALNDSEKSLVEKICTALQNNPLRIIQAAVAVHDGEKSLSQLAQELDVSSSRKNIYDQILSSLPDSQKQALALMATFGGAPLPEEHMAKMLDAQNFSQLIGDLIQKGLAVAHSPRYSVPEELRDYLFSEWDLSDWKNVALQYFVNWVAKPISQTQVLDASDALFAVLGNASVDGRWRELLQIGKAIEPAFFLSGQWGAWTRLLNLLLQACRALGDRFSEAWVLHQLGSQALCLQDLTQARDLLSQALDIRRAVGDRVGISATQHNLGLLSGAPPSNKPPRSNGGTASSGRWLLPIFVTVGILVILAAGAIWISPFNPFTSSPTPTFTSTATLTPSVTPTFTETITPTFTPLPTPVPVLEIGMSYPDPNAKDVVMLYQGQNQDYFEVPVLVSIKNTSAIIVDNLSVELSYDGNSTQLRTEKQSMPVSDIKLAPIPPGQSVSLDVKMIVPISYNNKYVKATAVANRCGVNVECQIVDASIQLPNVVFDFVDNSPNASWWGGIWYDASKYELQQNQIMFNGDPNDSNGIVNFDDSINLEDGSQPLYLFARPKQASYGAITGYFDLSKMNLQPDDQFVARVGFRNGSQASNGVIFNLGCMTRGSEFPVAHTLFSVPKKYDGVLENIFYSLSNDDVNKICSSTYYIQVAGSTSDADWSAWVSAFIERPNRFLIPFLPNIPLLPNFIFIPTSTPTSAPIP